MQLALKSINFFRFYSMRSYTIFLIPPFRLDLTVWALRRTPSNAIDLWDGKRYSRILVRENNLVDVTLEQDESPDKLNLKIKTDSDTPSLQEASEIRSILEKILGLRINLSGFYDIASESSRLSALSEKFMGVKPPRFPTVFEAVVNAISCQQISLTVGILLLNRLSAKYGLPFNEKHAFPRPQDLIRAQPQDLNRLGFSHRKAEYILGLARDIVDGKLDLESLEKLPAQSAIDRLMQIRGIGLWTAEYVLLRGLGRLDIIPADDSGFRNKIKKWLNLHVSPEPDSIREKVSAWAPYSGMIYFLLLLDSMSQKGIIESAGKNLEIPK
jgi:DNA-3-methyladenine glycosylase II